MALSPDPDEWDVKFNRVLKCIGLASAVLAAGTMAVLEIQFFRHTGFEPWLKIAQEHFLASVALSGFALVSFGIVIVLRQIEGPIEFEAWGMKFRGAAGQVVLWVICVVSLSLCAKMLW